MSQMTDSGLQAALTQYRAHFEAIRKDIHAHPEIGYEEFRTAELIARELTDYGIEVLRGMAGTGVIGVLRGGNGSGGMIGLRADIDALPMTELNQIAYRSQNAGRAHMCGHDGHTSMLLMAAKYLAETRHFDGTVVFIFQPAEEGGAGAVRMIEEGLFERFPVEAVYGMHNIPDMPAGEFAVMPGPMMAAVDAFRFDITAKGGHGAMPHTTADPIVAGATLVHSLQTLISRVRDPLDPAVLSVAMFQGGEALNVIPSRVSIGGTARTLSKETRAMIVEGMRRQASAVSEMYGLQCEFQHLGGGPATVNHPQQAAFAAETFRKLFGTARVADNLKPLMASEDFSAMLEARPGAYLWIGNGPSAALHTPNYDFNDAILVPGAAAWVGLVEASLGDR